MQVLTAAQGIVMQPMATGGIDGVQQMAQGGDFLAMILQMMGQNAEGMIPTQNGLISNNDMIQNLEEELEENGSEAAMELLAGLFVPSIADAATLISPEQSAIASAVTSGSHMQNLLALISGKPTPNTQQPIVQPQTEQVQGKDFVEILNSNVLDNSVDTQPEGTLTGQNQFQNAIMQAQKQLQTVPKDEQHLVEKTLDIDKLQKEVDSGRYINVGVQPPLDMSETQVVKAESAIVPNVQEILAQVKTGITANLNSGKNEFVIRLKPEGLGEITVKMMEVGNKITLSIITSSAQTERAINSEIAGLREALRPLNAEVVQVVSQDNTSYFHSGEQSFSEHQHRQFSDDRKQAFYGKDDAMDSDELFEQAVSVDRKQSQLDAYI